MSAVRYQGVRKTFDTFTALHSLDLKVPDRSFMALLGPSGCGKTTALRILAGLDMPTSGRVLIGERDVTRLQPRDRDVAMVFQSYALYPHKTVRDNIGYPLWIRKVEPAPTSRRRSARSRRSSRSITCSTGARANSRAASASVWRWRAPSCAIPLRS